MQHNPDIALSLAKSRHDDLIAARDNRVRVREARAARRNRQAEAPALFSRLLERISGARTGAARPASASVAAPAAR